MKNNLVFLTGAGLSKACHYPTTHEMMDSFRRLLDETNEGKELDQILINVVKASGKHIRHIDIEEIYTIITSRLETDQVTELSENWITQTYLRLYYSFAHSDEFDGLQKRIENFIDELFWRSEGKDSDNLRSLFPKEFIEKNAKMISIFTTNYDLTVERYFNNQGIREMLNVGVTNETFNASNYRRGGLIPYVKLHGSSNLYVTDNDRIRKSSVRVNFDSPNEYGEMPMRYYITYPYIGKPYYDKQQKDMLQLLDEKLSEADWLVIVGSSLRDNEIVDIINKNMKGKRYLFIGNQDVYNRAVDITPGGHEGSRILDIKYPEPRCQQKINGFYSAFQQSSQG